jgi:hypothetical protein
MVIGLIVRMARNPDNWLSLGEILSYLEVCRLS